MTPPALVRAKPAGRGRRLTFRVPAGGVPDAPAINERRGGRCGSDGASGADTDGRGDAAAWTLKHELYLIALRVWLAELPAPARLNNAERRRTGTAAPRVLLDRARELRAQLSIGRQRALTRGAEEQPFVFADALRAVLDGEVRQVVR